MAAAASVMSFGIRPLEAADEGYTYSLKELISKAEEKIEMVNEELEQQRIEAAQKERERLAREHFEKGNRLYEQGQLKEAKKEWQKVLELTEDENMKSYIKKKIKRRT